MYGLQVEWCGGSETIEEALARIHQREEAAVKRERAMAYAFNHQVQWMLSAQFKFINLIILFSCSFSISSRDSEGYTKYLVIFL